jgi:EmrB/QacA subfamily drug resistance transporter
MAKGFRHRADSPPEESGEESGSSRMVTVAMVLAVSMSFIDQTIVAIASPEIQDDLDLTATQGQWVINAYLVALAACFALGGRVADVWGRRRMVLVGVAGFAVCSALCGATPTGSSAETWMVSARAGQGVFAALLLPAAIAIVYSSSPVARRGRAMAMFFGITGAFTAVGPILGDYLLEWSWRAIFYINLPVAVAATICTVAAKFDDQREEQRIDWFGAVLVAAGMALSVIGFTQSAVWGWEDLRTWACLVVGAALLVVFVVVERRTDEPLIKLRIFRSKAFRIDSAVLFLAMIGFVPVSYFISIYASVSLGLDASGTTTLLLYFFLGLLIAAQLGGRIYDARGAKLTVMLGCLVGAAGFVWWASQVTDLDGHRQHYPLLLAGAGIGLLLGPVSTDAVGRAQDASYGEVTGINQTVRNYGSSLGFAVLGTVLTHVFVSKFTSSLEDLGVPNDRAESAAHRAATGNTESTGDIPSSIRAGVEHAVTRDFAEAMQVVVYGMAIALFLAFLVALLHPGDRPTPEPEGDHEAAGSGPVRRPEPAETEG